ncbi:MAG: leucyl aminopeptidase [Methylobacter sp.]|nr:MAG: leucyl aminopeptidase [Methylobacter sp.]PPD32488.1 MAG: leucyl aminopeptidase [Methylomonas sp.]
MDYSIESTPLEKLQCDCLIAGVFADKSLSPAAQQLDILTHGLIARLVERGDVTGETGEALLINAVPNSKIERILLAGLGKKEALNGKNYRKTLAAAINSLKKLPIKDVVCALAENPVSGCDLTWKIRQIAEVFGDAAYQFTQLKSDKTLECKVEQTRMLAPEAEFDAAGLGLRQGRAIADAINLTKHMADLPGNVCTPTYLAEQAIAVGKKSAKTTVEILEEEDMEALGMGSFLSVTRGSRQPAKLICLNYQGGEKNAKPVVLVGKGLTFDAGGISLKPGPGMDEMKYDMCGGAAVIGTLQAVAQLELPLNVIGLVPASENLPDGNANKPGDIWTSMSGKTIEILNTDAEGRLILCDTLTYAERFNPDAVIDLATLTGACLVALGRVPSGLLGNDDELCNALIRASEIAVDSVWRLPLWEEYQELLKSNFADMANIGGKDAGTITAACFLSRFTENVRWAHLDIAGTAWRTGLTKGATGRPVPLLCQYLLDRVN